MKTREELNESDLFHLETFEAGTIHNAYNAWAKKSYGIGKKIAENLKPKMWESSKKEWIFDSDTIFETRFLYNLERQCHTEKEAKRRLKMEKDLNIINSYILETNEKEFFDVDWDDTSQDKYHVKFGHIEKSWIFTNASYYQIAGTEYCSKETAIDLCKLLNARLVNGISKP